ncbi:hypothetical protein M0208_13685 [Sphingomonas sp. SUN019]|uniref:hypothetical protein n=1 Tax=Sphingomonas sp. SUN019 TaxID=2937788 RepID=UPI002164481E|nr:hypothetical protein [Sphingomonas sp. SUN019]UVO51502.1 hypothetical protein M0208_13685 [Sphingomonas sp. SUN019]
MIACGFSPSYFGMTQHAPIELDRELQDAAQAAAAWRDMSLQEYARQVIARASEMDAELAAFVQEGIDSADRGELISQEEMEAWFEARRRSAAAE